MLQIAEGVCTLRSLIDSGVKYQGWGQEKYIKLIVGGWNSREGWKKVKILIAMGRAGFFVYFSNHGKYSIKNICVYSKCKIKAKAINKQNLDDKLKIVQSQVL